jgi:hypothetical protein
MSWSMQGGPAEEERNERGPRRVAHDGRRHSRAHVWTAALLPRPLHVRDINIIISINNYNITAPACVAQKPAAIPTRLSSTAATTDAESCGCCIPGGGHGWYAKEGERGLVPHHEPRQSPAHVVLPGSLPTPPSRRSHCPSSGPPYCVSCMCRVCLFLFLPLVGGGGHRCCWSP